MSSSFTISPLRAASRHMRLCRRTLNPIQAAYAVRTASTANTNSNSSSKPNSTTPAPQSKPATTNTSSKPATTTNTNNKNNNNNKQSTPYSSSSSNNKPAARKPIPPFSGRPLPDAPGTSSTSSTSTSTPTPTNDTTTNTNSNGGEGAAINWEDSYHGIGTSAFSPETAAILQAPIDPEDIEVKPDGIIYLPEIKYRRILNAAFGPGGWGLAPRGELFVQDRLVTREYALIVHGRFIGQARGEQQYFHEDGVSTAAEGAKSNALMRCCKDLGIASELWDPRFIRKFMKEYAVQQWVEHANTKKRKQIWLRKDDEVRFPFKKV
ncbi:mitochondrial genome maintenance MGM101-domain-containing protein [Xylariaceae sp. FL0594]|nr:mitochondrial genome maintenance MGM101-domain-containing protein [Xylariaceae sp. FL0594]